MVIPTKALHSHIGIIGTTGAGKSFTARRIVENLLSAGRQCVIFDPTGVWWGIRSSYDGEGDGFPVVIFGGEHQSPVKPAPDVILTDSMGTEVADFVVKGDTSIILDFSTFTDAAIARFMTAYLQRIFVTNVKPLYQAFDEADTYAPQRPQPGETRMVGLMGKHMKQGRTKGLRNILITQRPAAISKNVLSQTKTMIAMLLTLPLDRKPIEDWFKGATTSQNYTKFSGELGLLETGEGFVCSTMIKGGHFERVKFPMIETFDSMKTPEDDDDEVSLRPKTWRDIDLSAIQDSFSKDNEAEEEVSLQKDVLKPDAKPAPIPQDSITIKAHKEVVAQRCAKAYTDGKKEGYANGYNRGYATALQDAQKQIGNMPIAQISADVNIYSNPTTERKHTVKTGDETNRSLDQDVSRPHGASVQGERHLISGVTAGETAPLSKGAKEMFGAIMDAYPRAITFRAAAKFAGRSIKSSAFPKACKELESRQGVDLEQIGINLWRIPDHYAEAIDLTIKSKDPQAIIQHWASRFTPAIANMLNKLFVVGTFESRSAWAEASGVSPNSSTVGTALRELKSNGLAVEEGGQVSIHPDFRVV